MIKLDVDPYCHECEKFEASVIGPEKTVLHGVSPDGTREKIVELSDTVIQCTYRARCRAMYRDICERLGKGD